MRFHLYAGTNRLLAPANSVGAIPIEELLSIPVRVFGSVCLSQLPFGSIALWDDDQARLTARLLVVRSQLPLGSIALWDC